MTLTPRLVLHSYSRQLHQLMLRQGPHRVGPEALVGHVCVRCGKIFVLKDPPHDWVDEDHVRILVEVASFGPNRTWVLCNTPEAVVLEVMAP